MPINDLIRGMAAAEGAVLVDLYQAFDGQIDTLIGADGLHPNEAGYQQMAETFFTAVRARLEMPPIVPTLHRPTAPLRNKCNHETRRLEAAAKKTEKLCKTLLFLKFVLECGPSGPPLPGRPKGLHYTRSENALARHGSAPRIASASAPATFS